MQRKRSVSNSKNPKKKALPKKKACSICSSSHSGVQMIQHALFVKYSLKHFTQPRIIDQLVATSKPSNQGQGREHLNKYYKAVHRKHEFRKIKQIYQVHQEFPRLFMPGVREILSKHHHRKRLLDYFKMAKMLGIKVQDVKFSTFLLSITKSQHPLGRKKSYIPLLSHISGYEFSQDIERQIVQTLGYRDPNPEALGWHEKKAQSTADYE